MDLRSPFQGFDKFGARPLLKHVQTHPGSKEPWPAWAGPNPISPGGMRLLDLAVGETKKPPLWVGRGLFGTFIILF